MKKSTFVLALAMLLPTMPAAAHTALCACYDLGENTILCEGGFSDGSSAAGVSMTVVDKDGKALLKGEINDDGEFEFAKPTVDYKVIFNAGPGHAIEIDGKEIVE